MMKGPHCQLEVRLQLKLQRPAGGRCLLLLVALVA